MPNKRLRSQSKPFAKIITSSATLDHRTSSFKIVIISCMHALIASPNNSHFKIFLRLSFSKNTKPQLFTRFFEILFLFLPHRAWNTLPV